MGKARNKPLWLPFEAWPTYVGVCFTQKAFDKVARSHGFEPFGYLPGGAGTARCWTLRHSTSNVETHVMCFPATKHLCPIEFAGIVAHESMHVLQKLSEYVNEDNATGMDLGTETEAYTIQMMVLKVMDHYAKVFRDTKYCMRLREPGDGD